MDELSCEEVLQRMEVYLDGEVDAEESRRIERHLAGCGECFERRSFVTRLREIVRRKGGAVERLPSGLPERIRRAIAGAGSAPGG